MNEKNINPDDLMGDIVPEIDPQKLFDEKEYSTIVLGNEETSKNDENNADFLTIIIGHSSTREEKDAALLKLKENKAQAFMMQAISRIKKPDHKATTIAACWETGLDFSAYLTQFTELVNDSNYLVSLEAFTVIEEMAANLNQEQVLQSIQALEKSNEKGPLYSDCLNFLKSLHL
jgi:hypothetical protein